MRETEGKKQKERDTHERQTEVHVGEKKRSKTNTWLGIDPIRMVFIYL